MKSFEVNGKSYDSMSDFCKKTGVSYHKMRRLCRKYLRAQKDPSVAARWLLGFEKINRSKEPLTVSYIRDKELSQIRYIAFKTRQKLQARRRILKILG